MFTRPEIVKTCKARAIRTEVSTCLPNSHSSYICVVICGLTPRMTVQSLMIFHLRFVASTEDPCFITLQVEKWWFSNSSSLRNYLSVKNSYPSSHPVLMCTCHYGLTEFLKVQCIIGPFHLWGGEVAFNYQLSQMWVMAAFQPKCPFEASPSMFQCFLASWQRMVCRHTSFPP